MKIKDYPIKRKIIFVMMLTCLSALFIAGAIFFAFQIKNYNTELRTEMETIAKLIGSNSQAAIEFDDRKAADQILAALREDARIQSASLFDVNSKLFAHFKNATNPTSEMGDYLIIKQPIHIKDKIIGSLMLEVNSMSGFYKRLWEFGAVAILTIMLAALSAYAISTRLQRVISLPIINLAETARNVSLKKDYSLRADKHSNDEIGMLIEQFNNMLEQIKKEDSSRRRAEDELKVLNEELELRVAERSEELRQSLEKLRRSERLASIGTLAAGMAHEIRNPINSISLAAQHALRYQKDLNEMQEKTLSSIANEAIRCGTIIKNILLFARSEKTSKSLQNINDIIHKAVILAKTYAQTSSVEINLDLAADLGSAPINSTEIEQVIVNILNNAIEAAGGKVKIVVKTSSLPDRIILTIEDNGPGIPNEMLGQIFDPFFSTKRKQGNTGLGLSLCHGIVSEHQGFMNVRSEVGKGTVFTIELPREII
jgi:signal transduction histidine kinase